MVASSSQLRVFKMGINTHQEPVVYMRDDCDVCLSEGFSASSRVGISSQGRSIIATLNISSDETVPKGYAGLSDIAIERLGVAQSDLVSVHHAPYIESLSLVRRKVFGHSLLPAEMARIVSDISAHKYSDVEIACFLSACAGGRLGFDEIVALTQAMVNCGQQLDWPGVDRVFDKHCVGGLPGNRTTPLVVSIVSAAGLVMPKTSSRAITSPAGTADTMEALTNVRLGLNEIRRVVRETGACLAWGGAMNLSPADDLLIRIERALDLDGEGQLVASVLSKKIAAGSTHAVIDIPVGETAKVRTPGDADRLASLFTSVGAACGLKVRCIATDGSKPVGAGIGPTEEARDVLAVLQGKRGAPEDLRSRAILLAGHLFDLADGLGVKEGMIKAERLLQDGSAWEQFKRITKAQGGLKSLGEARFRRPVLSSESGTIVSIDNRRLARVAKLAGAPASSTAGLRLLVNVGDIVIKGEPLYELLSDSPGQQDYALAFNDMGPAIFTVSQEE
ncbi:thymidine phosphorylase family protein [Marinobacter sp. UBA2498]|jgi:thymidine phosphorylase|uniref:thymidine phosphorylase family protein n=1 Tax=Marinobacter sp. UBA2498 TaxID=1946813 RepID=UPI00257C6402|nr:thymidine phosphorylase family protein [Marinobacter sp. UBA2498]